MQRRTFLQSTLATGGLCAVPSFAAAEPSRGPREFYEVRTYQTKPGRQEALDLYLEKALIPALNRQGLKPIGAMTELPVPAPGGSPAPATGAAAATPATTLIIPYPSLEHFANVGDALAADEEFATAAADYAAIPATEPVYERVDSALLSAFAGMPKLQVPSTPSRLFNLRIYESHSEAAGDKKIEMFNRGEIDIFRRVGLTPVLFGKTIAGTRMPNLTYLLVFENEEARVAAWNRFRADPEWLKLKAIPEYEDKRIVSKITNRLLAPTKYSQL